MRGLGLGTGQGAFLERGAMHSWVGCTLHRGAQQRGCGELRAGGVLFYQAQRQRSVAHKGQELPGRLSKSEL